MVYSTALGKERLLNQSTNQTSYISRSYHYEASERCLCLAFAIVSIATAAHQLALFAELSEDVDCLTVVGERAEDRPARIGGSHDFRSGCTRACDVAPTVSRAGNVIDRLKLGQHLLRICAHSGRVYNTAYGGLLWHYHQAGIA